MCAVYDSGDGGFSVATQTPGGEEFRYCGGVHEAPCLHKAPASDLPSWQCDEYRVIVAPGAAWPTM
jgi:hypothetical protein